MILYKNTEKNLCDIEQYENSSQSQVLKKGSFFISFIPFV